ncbi:hypothetical protein HPK20_15715 [Vibrio fluvialis]|nr:hypothetical protein [Vibrio fluvialis]QKE35946.1 hypothetical protein HPK20_15715 [Vibrio fluvialis]
MRARRRHGDVTLAATARRRARTSPNTSVTITYEGGTTATVAVNADGTFDVAVPADDTTQRLGRDTEDAEYEGDETFTLRSDSDSGECVTGTADHHR